jgi:hypothetical protein
MSYLDIVKFGLITLGVVFMVIMPLVVVAIWLIKNR